VFYIYFLSQRRAQKAAEIAELKSKKYAMRQEDELASEDDGDSDEPESEEGVDSNAEEERARRKEVRRTERRKEKRVAGAVPHVPRPLREGQRGGSPGHGYRAEHRGSGHASRGARSWQGDEDADAEGSADADGDPYVEDDGAGVRSAVRGQVRRPWPVGLADLDSPSGR